MTYGFGEDKSKAEVYTKNDFVVIEGSVSFASSDEQTKTVTITANELLNEYGIEDITEYVSISVMQESVTNNFRTAFKEIDTVIYPFAVVYTTGLTIGVYSGFASAVTHKYKVVLMKVT